jgi:hypothetical protein
MGSLDFDMAILSQSDFKALIEQTHDPCLSLYMPTYRIGAEMQQNLIQFRNLLRDAEQKFLARGVRRPEVEALLEPAQALLSEHPFWEHQAEGLAVFLAPEVFQPYRVPLKLNRFAIVADRFHVKPLLPLFIADGQFYVLTLSQNAVRLFQGTRFSIQAVELKGIPTSLAEAMRYTVVGKQLQFHTSTQAPGGPGGRRQAMFFGESAERDEEKTNLLQFFQQVDEGLRHRLKDIRRPLVLAGVDYLLPLYREASEYPNILPEGIPGNPDRLNAEALQARAWEIVEPIFQSTQQGAFEHYQELAGSGSPQASSDLQSILTAAYIGRVHTLWVARDQLQWGLFDPATTRIYFHQSPEASSVDLLDLAVAYTVLNGGAAYAVELAHVPHQQLAAAVFRY